GSADVKVTLSIPAADGKLRVTSGLSGGVTAAQVSGSNTNVVTVTAPLAAINTTFANSIGLIYFPAQDFNGTVALQLATDDLGNTGAGGALTDTDTSTITVAAVNDPPAPSVPGDQLTAEDTAILFSLANGNPITVTDVDAGSGLKVTLTATNG